MITNLRPDGISRRTNNENTMAWGGGSAAASRTQIADDDLEQALPAFPNTTYRRRPLRLNLGCGNDLREGYVNVDDESSNRITGGRFIQHDLTDMPWPFEDESVEEVLMWHVLEHLSDTYRVMAEIRRILRPGGVFHGQVPFAFSYNSVVHPQHCRHFTHYSFQKLGEDFGFEVNARPGNIATTWQHKLRNVIPFKGMFCIFLLNIYDTVDFEMVKK
jgi:SAM-dependent methyltransferase